MATPSQSYPSLPTDPPHIAEVDPNIPSIARIYDFYLGGTNNYPQDRKIAESVVASFPTIKDLSLENRTFLRRVVRYLSREHGIRQFLDIGSGLPTVENTHEVAIKAVKHSGGNVDDIRCVYVDIDPVVKLQSAHILAEFDRSHEDGGAKVKAITGDATKMAELLGSPEVTATIDFGQPVAVLCLALFHFMSDEVIQEIMGELSKTLVEGSFVVLSHITTDGVEESKAQQASRLYEKQGIPLIWRSKEEFAKAFAPDMSWVLIEPGVVKMYKWRDEELLPSDGNIITGYGYGAVAKKTKRG